MQKGRSGNLIRLESSVTEYFQQQVEQALCNQRVEADGLVSTYLVDLLAGFLRSESLYAEEDEDLKEKPLALVYAKALTSLAGVRIRLLKYLGDFSMFFSGYFSESFQRKVIDVDYLISMGEVAYEKLHICLQGQREDPALSSLFLDLSARFTTYVDVLSEISEEDRTHTARDLLRLYEKWLKTGSARTADQLRRQGILPNETLPKTYLQ